MFPVWFRPQTDEELKAVARKNTQRLLAEVARQGIRVEMATQHTLDEIRRDLLRQYQEFDDA